MQSTIIALLIKYSLICLMSAFWTNYHKHTSITTFDIQTQVSHDQETQTDVILAQNNSKNWHKIMNMQMLCKKN